MNNILRNRVGDKRGTWVPNQRDYLHRILLIRAHNSCNKIISCKGQLITPQGTIPEGESFQSPQLPYASWPLPDIGLCIRGSCTNKYDSLHLTLPLLPPPPLYFTINVAQCMVSPRRPCFAIQHTILALVLAISCKGQCASLMRRAAL